MSSTLAIGISIHQNSGWLGDDLVNGSDEALSAHEDRQYTLAVVKTGACLEGLIKGLLKDRGIAIGVQPTLGPLIGALRDSGSAPPELFERLNEANTIRNRNG